MYILFRSIVQWIRCIVMAVRMYVHGFLEMIGQDKVTECFLCTPKAGIDVDVKKVIIVTGGLSGIGWSISQKLSKLGYTVIAAAPQLVQDITTLRMNNIHFMLLDLSSFTSIENFVISFNAIYAGHLEYLINNAGVMLLPWTQTKQGFEAHYGINFLGHSYLTLLLMKQKLKVINVCSSVHKLGNSEEILSCDYRYETQASYSAHRSYINSKKAILLFTKCLVHQMKQRGIALEAYSVHPGVVDSGLYQNVCCPLRLIQKYLFSPWFFRTCDQGANVIVSACLTDHPEEMNGCYLENDQRFQVTYRDEYKLLWAQTTENILKHSSKEMVGALFDLKLLQYSY